MWRAPYVRYEPSAQVAHAHRTEPRAWLARRVYYGRTAAAIARRHPGKARPLARLAVDDRRLGGRAGCGRPNAALAITATATALLARETDLAHGGRARRARHACSSGRVVADALTRHWWPLALAHPRTRVAFLTKPPLPLARRPRLRHWRVARVHPAPHARPTSARQSLEARSTHSVRLRRR